MLARTIAPNATSPNLASFVTPFVTGFPKAGTGTASTRSASVVTEAHHLSLIQYDIPQVRAAAILPAALVNAGFTIKTSQGQAKLIVLSYLDHRLGGFGAAATEAFEQTFYWLLLQRDGETYYWQINSVVGSLTAVSSRNLWQTPWHLGAMELQASYDETNHRYQGYRIQTQSEHLNATWELADSGELLPNAPLAPVIRECYVRHDKQIGLRQLRFRITECSVGSMLSAKCDQLDQSGLLSVNEMKAPSFIGLSRSASLEISNGTIFPSGQNFLSYSNNVKALGAAA